MTWRVSVACCSNLVVSVAIFNMLMFLRPSLTSAWAPQLTVKNFPVRQHTLRRHCRCRLSTTSSKSEPVKVPLQFVPYPFQYREEVDCVIESITNGGLGIARIEVPPRGDDAHRNSAHMKWVVMVPSVIPGEHVRVRIFRNYKNYSDADLVTVVQASPDRVNPVCPLAGDCGGCQLQHMSIELQREWKTKLVQQALEQYGLADAVVAPCLGTEHVFGYRSKLTPHYQHPSRSRRGVSNEKGNLITAIGFQRRSSRQTLDVPSCPIATPEVNAKYQVARQALLSTPPNGKKGASLLFRQANLEDEYVETDHNEFMTTRVEGLDLTYRAGNFFQNNYHVLPLMVNHVVEQATAGGGMTHLADCYCGSGLFALAASKHFQQVVGIEISTRAIAEAAANARANNIANCEFKAASAEGIFSVIQGFPRDTTAVVLDPPRKGCSEGFLEQLCGFAPRRIVYMSCDPTTQARDAASIVASGYTITSIQPFDLFPQTRHIECLMILERHN